MTVDRQAQAVRDMFSQSLCRIRAARKLSQEDLAYLTDMHRTEISALERGKREPRLQTLIKLSAALDTPLNEFFTGIEWRPLVLAPISEGMGSYHVTPPRKSEE
ncbi:MAG TPA: helix-turn-helix transcriptional regulator [Thermoanaerobaculia bacterium]|nr:helix-turn-helix transcriptional regulator [Thermoanaerobaculia bacterium]